MMSFICAKYFSFYLAITKCLRYGGLVLCTLWPRFVQFSEFCSSREDHEYWHQPHGPLRADCLHRTIPVPVDRPVPAHTSHPKRLCTHQNIAPPDPLFFFQLWSGDEGMGGWVRGCDWVGHETVLLDGIETPSSAVTSSAAHARL